MMWHQPCFGNLGTRRGTSFDETYQPLSLCLDLIKCSLFPVERHDLTGSFEVFGNAPAQSRCSPSTCQYCFHLGQAGVSTKEWCGGWTAWHQRIQSAVSDSRSTLRLCGRNEQRTACKVVCTDSYETPNHCKSSCLQGTKSWPAWQLFGRLECRIGRIAHGDQSTPMAGRTAWSDCLILA